MPNWLKKDSKPDAIFSSFQSVDLLMATPFEKYAKVKDRYCIAYFGPYEKFIQELVSIRPFIEKELEGIEIYISCNPGFMYLVENEPRIVPRDKLNRHDFGCIREIKYDLQESPVKRLLEESNLIASLEQLEKL